MRARRMFSLALFAAGGALGCGGGGDGSGSTPTTPTTPSTPSTPAAPSPPAPAAPAPSTPAVVDVVVGNNSFAPAAVTVRAGDTVRWTWSACSSDPDPYGSGGGQSCTDHNVTWDAGNPGPSATQSQGTYSRTFDVRGTWSYHCVVHGMAMSGTVVVL